MLRKSIISLALVVASIAGVQAADFKVGVVDTKLVLSKAPQLQAANEKIKEQFKGRQDELIALQKQGEQLQQKAQRDQMTMTNVQRLELDRQMQEIETQLNLKNKFFQEDLKIASSQEQQKMMKKISEAISKIAADEKFDLIIAKGVVVHATQSIDITEKVITMISNPAG